MVRNNGQMKIMQMAFMILAVFIFFVLVGLFFLVIQFRDIESDVARLEAEQAISSLETIANMPELNFDSRWSMAVDEDKLKVMSGSFGDSYDNFWPVASIRVYKIYPVFSESKKCPEVDCNYYEIYDNGQSNVKTYAAFISICSKVDGGARNLCEIGKMVVGVVSREE